MRTPIVLCAHCGSESVRRSKRQSFGELVRMYMGVYPFRCMDCETRFFVSIWLFSKLPFAKCPKCLNVQLSVWPAKYFAPSLWRGVAVMFGARRYRCMPCRHNFVSFRPMLPGSSASEQAARQQEQEGVAPDSDSVLVSGNAVPPEKS